VRRYADEALRQDRVARINPLESSTDGHGFGGPVRLDNGAYLHFDTGVVTADSIQVRTMLVGALGCNSAWGIIDAGRRAARTPRLAW
jgi:hypothetical protein